MQIHKLDSAGKNRELELEQKQKPTPLPQGSTNLIYKISTFVGSSTLQLLYIILDRNLSRLVPSNLFNINVKVSSRTHTTSSTEIAQIQHKQMRFSQYHDLKMKIKSSKHVPKKSVNSDTNPDSSK